MFLLLFMLLLCHFELTPSTNNHESLLIAVQVATAALPCLALRCLHVFYNVQPCSKDIKYIYIFDDNNKKLWKWKQAEMNDHTAEWIIHLYSVDTFQDTTQLIGRYTFVSILLAMSDLFVLKRTLSSLASLSSLIFIFTGLRLCWCCGKCKKKRRKKEKAFMLLSLWFLTERKRKKANLHSYAKQKTVAAGGGKGKKKYCCHSNRCVQRRQGDVDVKSCWELNPSAR